MADGWREETYCYVATRGRRTGRPHTIEIWFGSVDGATLYVLSGGGERSDWVRNVRADPSVKVRIGRGGEELPGRARFIEDPEEDGLARRLLASKYQGWREGARMSSWARMSLPVALELGARP